MLVDIEIDILTKKIEYPELPIVQPNDRTYKTPLFWRGCLNELLELICALFYSISIVDNNGQKPSFSAYIACWEQFLNVKLGNVFNKRAQLAARKKNLTPLLDKLKYAYLQEIEKVGIERQ